MPWIEAIRPAWLIIRDVMNAVEIVREIESTGIVAIIRADGGDELIDVVRSLREGGLTCIEVTMTTPNALEVIRSAREKIGEDAAIGVGTVLDGETARSAILAGAQFVVAPIVDLPTIEMCKRYSVPVVPGAMTPTEMVRAWQAGSDFVKAFPSSGLGTGFIKDIRGPLPQLKLIPTGGISLENVGEFFKAGASAVGVGSALARKDWMRQKDYSSIRQAASAWLAKIRQARESG